MAPLFSNRITKIKNRVANPQTFLLLYTVLAVISTIQAVVGTAQRQQNGQKYTKYNNYIIFERSFHHLIHQQDLYIPYPEEHWDLYKYTPTFSVFFGLFSWMPDWLGLLVWTLLNALVLFWGIYRLPNLTDWQKGMIYLIVTIEMMTALQNQQSNALIAGLILLGFGQLLRVKLFWATFCLVCTVFIKLFGVVAFVLLVFSRKKLLTFAYTGLWLGVMTVMPLLFIDFNHYGVLIKSYRQMLSQDHNASYGLSVMGWLNSWFGLEDGKTWIVLIGVCIFVFPLIFTKSYKDLNFQYKILASMLIWVVIFNHKAESPTFVIAVTGVAIWYVRSSKTKLDYLLWALVFVFTVLSPTDLFPKTIREAWVKPYTLKAVPCILVWTKIVWEMHRNAVF